LFFIEDTSKQRFVIRMIKLFETKKLTNLISELQKINPLGARKESIESDSFPWKQPSFLLSNGGNTQLAGNLCLNICLVLVH